MLELTSVVSGGRKNFPEDALNKEFDEILQESAAVAETGFPNPWLLLLLTPSGTSVGNGAAGLTPSGTAVGSGTGTPLWMHVPFLLPFLAP